MTALNISGSTLNLPSTSGSYTFSVTRDDIIRDAMLDICALDPHEWPTAQEITDCARRLNMIVKQHMGRLDRSPGLKVWTRKRAALFLGNTKRVYNLGQTGDHWVDSTTGLSYPNLYGQTTLTAAAVQGATVLQVASTQSLNVNDYLGIMINADIFWTKIAAIGLNSVTIPAPGIPAGTVANSYVWNYTKKAVRPLDMITTRLRDIYANDTPLRIIRTVEEYDALPTVASPSNIADPTSIMYESQFKSQTPNGQLYLDVYGAQDITKHLECTFLAPTEDMLSPGDAPDYPQQWYLPLVKLLGKEIAPMFECVWTADLESSLNASLPIAEQADPEVSDDYFQVNPDPYQ